MIAARSFRAVPMWVKVLLTLVLLWFLIVQGQVLLGPGGIMSKYTFLQGFTVFGDLMRADPLTTAGLIDLIVLELTMVIVLANGLPKDRHYPWLLAVFIIALIVYPGLACLGFLLLYWRRLGQFRP
jgi:hypothetical protein